MNPPSEADYPVEIRGFVTDPKAVGFQVLTNYESTFVRAFVGNDAWGLYEVLRSFCHDGKNTCHPSINYLLSILGIKQRRVLTGWTTRVKGKEYIYPGLIELLQQAELVIAEVDESGPNPRYIFHVNLTPNMLTPQQVETLPPLMQTKHAELIQRHLDTLAGLESKRRPAKVGAATTGVDAANNQQNNSQNSPNPPNLVGEEGHDKLSDPMTNYHEGGDKLSQGSDNLSPKQQPINKTQETSSAKINSNNDNPAAAVQSLSPTDPDAAEREAAVAALLEQGMAPKVAHRLGKVYRPERIREKINYLTYLLEETSDRVRRPSGWLRRAIEENYSPPDGYTEPEDDVTKAAREAAERQRTYLPDEYLPYMANTQPTDAADTHQSDPALADADQGDSAPKTGKAILRENMQRSSDTHEELANEPKTNSAHQPDAEEDIQTLPVSEAATAQQGAPAAAQETTLTRAMRRTLLQRDHGVSQEAQAFWEMALHDLRHTTTADFYELFADVEIIALGDESIHLAVWSEGSYKRLQHPGLQKALSRDLSILAKRRLHVTVEQWPRPENRPE